MKRYSGWWIVGCVASILLLAGLIFAGQYNPSDGVSLEELGALLVTPEGESRLQKIDERLDEMETLIATLSQQVAALSVQQASTNAEMLRQFEAQGWAIADIKFRLEDMSRAISDVDDSVQNCCP